MRVTLDTWNVGYLGCMAMRDWVDEGVKVESWEIGILGLDINHGGSVVPRQVHVIWQGVVKIRKRDAIFCTYWLPDDDLIDVIKFIPIFISNELLVLYQGFKLWAPRNGQIESLGSEERLQIKQIEVIIIHQISEQLVTKAIEGRHDLQAEVPPAIGGATDIPADIIGSLQHFESTRTFVSQL